MSIQLKRGATDEINQSVVLLDGQPGVEQLLGGGALLKIGDGSTSWQSLPYVGTKGQTFIVNADLPTVFLHKDYAQQLSLEGTIPTEGSYLINTKGNAVYKYHTYNPGKWRIYVYQPMRDNVNAVDVNGSTVGALMGNFTTTGTANPYTGSQSATSSIYHQNNWRFDNSFNNFLHNSPMRLVACYDTFNPVFEYWESPTVSSWLDEVYYVISSHPSDYPDCVIGDDDNKFNDTIFIITAMVDASGSASVYPSTNWCDNGMCVTYDDDTMLEAWQADCWIDESSSYLIGKEYPVSSPSYCRCNVICAEQGGGQAFRLVGKTPTTSEQSFTQTCAKLQDSSTGEWVYCGPIYCDWYNRSYEATTDAPSSRSEGSWYTGNLTQFAKPGDIVIRTPSSFASIITSGLPIWQCRYVNRKFGTTDGQTQKWQRIF